ncbi:MAG: 30S ribosomal protein S12 methylthiotransferase RimO [Sedimentisphaerales bacterium]
MAKKQQKNATVGFISLGCPKNVVDSEKMLAEIAQAGFFITAEPDNADVVVINTCGFIEPAKAEALEAIRHAVDCKLSPPRRVKKVIVAGCLSQRLGRQLFSQVNGIDAIVGLGQRDNIARIIKKTISANQPAAYLGHWPEQCSDDRDRLLITGRHWAYLRISEGCNHRCSFCSIPAIKGPFRSKPQELVLAEAAELVSAGVVELNIIAQDTTYYGRDFKIKDGLATLLTKLEKIAEMAWIRLMYLWPAGIDDRLIETIAKSKKVVHYLDIPIQHVNNKILKAMCRPDTKYRLQKLIEKLRSSLPDVILRTTLIVGFPGETEQQFAELLDFVRWVKFDALGCFQFYPEAGTPAADMPGQISDDVKQQRVKELMLTQQKIAFAKNKNRIGSKLLCLVDSVDSSTARGRFYGQAPDIDSVCIIENCSANPGEFIDTRVVGSKDYDLLVQQI